MLFTPEEISRNNESRGRRREAMSAWQRRIADHAFLISCETGDRNIIFEALQNGASPNTAHHHSGDTGLIIVSKKGFTGCANLLLDHLANPFLLNKYNESALELAIRNGYEHTADAISKRMQPLTTVWIVAARLTAARAEEKGHLRTVAWVQKRIVRPRVALHSSP